MIAADWSPWIDGTPQAPSAETIFELRLSRNEQDKDAVFSYFQEKTVCERRQIAVHGDDTSDGFDRTSTDLRLWLPTSDSAGVGSWGNHHHYHQVVNVLEVTSSFLCSSQSQSMFPHTMYDAATLEMDALKNISINEVLETFKLLVQSSNSISMVESCTSDEDVCTASPEIPMNRSSPVSPVVTSLVDRTRSASGAALEDWNLRVPLSPCPVSADGLVHKMRQHQEEQTAFRDSYGCYVGVSPWSSSDPAPVTVLARSICESGSGGTDMDYSDVRAILFCHASQPVPSVEEMASSRPQRRNVRISKHPQSVAARHRRERIGDRMRVLQRLVPGGTKMDTASMLDEAIHYVKFLQLQVQTLEQSGSNSGNNWDSAQVASMNNSNNNTCGTATVQIQAAALPGAGKHSNFIH